ncbi:MAG TPA: hypothetical protein VGF45_08535, partial [Polyangia bacterium]
MKPPLNSSRLLTQWLVLAALAAGTFIACNSPNVVSTERAPGAGASPGSGAGGSNGGVGPGGGASGGSSGGVINLPDAAAPNPDVLPPPPMACAEQAHKAEAVPLDLLLLVDTSSSMDTRVGMATKWELAQGALTSFVRDQRSAGLGMGLQYFPNPKTCQAATDCGISLFGGCRGRTRCVDANGTPGPSCMTSLFGSSCPTGFTCVGTGLCSVSLADCLNIGQPCPNNEGTCEAGAKTCASSTTAEECNAGNYET